MEWDVNGDVRTRGGVEQGSRDELHLFWFAIDSLTTELEDLQLCNNRGPFSHLRLCEFIHFFIFGLKKIYKLELNSGITSHHPGHVPIKPSQ